MEIGNYVFVYVTSNLVKAVILNFQRYVCFISLTYFSHKESCSGQWPFSFESEIRVDKNMCARPKRSDDIQKTCVSYFRIIFLKVLL